MLAAVCLPTTTLRSCRQGRHTLTPNVDRFEIHPPVSTAPQVGTAQRDSSPWSVSLYPAAP